MISYAIYVVDDETLIREAFMLNLGRKYRIRTFATAEKAMAAIETEPPDLVLLDIGLPGMSGVDALKGIKSRFPDILVIMITARDDIDTVISAMKLGAYDYVVKPINMEGLEIDIGNALETIKLRKEVQLLQARYLRENAPFFIGESDVVQDVMALVEVVAKSPDTTVLILGETGTGKELIASTIHYKSPNFRGPFVTINCSAIPDELIESELFGYEKGAFSGAAPAGKIGLVESAAEGTLFLDEVGRKMGKSFSGLSAEAEQALKDHSWGGNVRELRNLIERAVLLGHGPDITMKDLGLDHSRRQAPRIPGSGAGDVVDTFPALSSDGIDLPRLHDDLDAHYFKASLNMAKGNASKAARLLNMSYYAFRRRRDKLPL